MDDENSSPRWKTPEEVMKLNRLKRRLNRRITEKSSLSFSSNTMSEDSLMEFPVLKRKYPFGFVKVRLCFKFLLYYFL